MTMCPEVFAKAQAEVDSVLGNSGDGAERLPTFEDRPRMPYVEAVLKEVLRWNPVGPMGMGQLYAHVTSAELEISFRSSPCHDRRRCLHGLQDSQGRYLAGKHLVGI